MIKSSDLFQVIDPDTSGTKTVSINQIWGVVDSINQCPINKIGDFSGHIILSDEENTRQNQESLKDKICKL